MSLKIVGIISSTEEAKEITNVAKYSLLGERARKLARDSLTLTLIDEIKETSK